MVSTQKDFGTLAKLYRELIRQTMILHNIAEIRCENEKERFFDRIVLKEDNGLEVYSHGLLKPLDNLYFDFTCDFATCLANIEHDLFLAERKGKPERGMIITFREKRRESKRAV